MKYLFLLLVILLAAVPYMARAEDFSAQNKGLPAVFKRVGFHQTYFCAVVKVTNADERVRDYIGRELSLNDIGSYAVLKEFHIMGAGGDGHPRLLERRAMSYLEAVAQLDSNPDCGAGEKELTQAEWHDEMVKSIALDNGASSSSAE
ncbi:MAG: hypothetical protein ACXWQO_15225 [Bdellovibrionota bacterium]